MVIEINYYLILNKIMKVEDFKIGAIVIDNNAKSKYVVTKIVSKEDSGSCSYDRTIMLSSYYLILQHYEMEQPIKFDRSSVMKEIRVTGYGEDIKDKWSLSTEEPFCFEETNTYNITRYAK